MALILHNPRHSLSLVPVGVIALRLLAGLGLSCASRRMPDGW